MNGHRWHITLLIALRNKLHTSPAEKYNCFLFSFTTDCNIKEKYSLATNAHGAGVLSALSGPFCLLNNCSFPDFLVAIRAFKMDLFLRVQLQVLSALPPFSLDDWRQASGELLALLPQEGCSAGGCPWNHHTKWTPAEGTGKIRHWYILLAWSAAACPHGMHPAQIPVLSMLWSYTGFPLLMQDYCTTPVFSRWGLYTVSSLQLFLSSSLLQSRQMLPSDYRWGLYKRNGIARLFLHSPPESEMVLW